MVLYIGICIESDWLYHAEWVALSNGQSGSELAEYSPTEENLIETMYKDTINRNKDIVYFYNILQAQESASTIAIDGRWGSGKTFFVCQTKLVINALNPSCDMDEEEKAKVTIRLPFPKNNEENENCSIAVYYDAWENDNDTEPVLSLIYEITKQLSVDFSLSDVSVGLNQPLRVGLI